MQMNKERIFKKMHTRMNNEKKFLKLYRFVKTIVSQERKTFSKFLCTVQYAVRCE